MGFVIDSDLRAVATRYDVSVPGRLLDAGMSIVAESMRTPVESAIKAETPVDTGQLQTSTSSSILPLPDGVMLQIDQDAESTDGQFYGQFVIHGHRIVAWGHDTGRTQPANDYPSRALVNVAPDMVAALYAGAGKLALSVASILA